MKNIVITIAREYGSGGRTVGEMLANDLGIHFYDKELAVLASEDSGINVALFNTNDEKVSGAKSLFKSMKNAYAGELISPDSDDFTSEDNLFNYQAKVIRQLAETTSCVIMGRCADYVLKDLPNMVNIYVAADIPSRVKRAIEVYDLPKAKAEENIIKFDKRRSNYYNFHTGKRWGDVNNYHISIRSDFGGIDNAVKTLIAYIGD